MPQQKQDPLDWLDDPLNWLDEPKFLDTAIGQRQYRGRNIADNIAKLKATKPRDEAHKQRLAKLVKSLESQQEGWTRPITPEAKLRHRGREENLVRGVAASGFGTMSLADLALVIPDLMGFESADEARRWIAEKRQTAKDFYDPQGVAGLVGEIGGELIGGGKGYGEIANVTAKVTGISKALAGAKAAKSLAIRTAAGAAENVVGGLPINIAQASGMKEASAEDKAKQFGIGTLADILFGAGFGAASKARAGAPKIESKTKVTLEPDAVREAEAAALVAKGQKRVDARSAIDNFIQAKWQEAHPNVPWTALSRKAQVDFKKGLKADIDAFKANQKPGEESGGEEVGGVEGAVKPTPTAPGGTEVDPYIVEVQGRSDISEFEKARLIEQYNKISGQLEAEAAKELPTNKAADVDNLHQQIKDALASGEVRDPAGVAALEWDKMSEVRRKMLLKELGLKAEFAKLNFDDLDARIQFEIANTDLGLTIDEKLAEANLPKAVEDIGYQDMDARSVSEREAAKRVDDLDAAERQSLADRWDAQHPDDKEAILEDVGTQKWERDDYKNRSFDKLPPDIQKALADPELGFVAGGKKETTEPKIEGGPPKAETWWSDLTAEGRSEVLSHTDADDLGLDKIENWNELPPYVQKQLHEILDASYGEPTVDVGRTVNEPSAAERHANARVPADVRNELLDIVIDAETGNWPDTKLQAQLDDFAARNEVSRDQVDQTLRDLGLGETKPNLDKGENLLERPVAQSDLDAAAASHATFPVRVEQIIEFATNKGTTIEDAVARLRSQGFSITDEMAAEAAQSPPFTHSGEPSPLSPPSPSTRALPDLADEEIDAMKEQLFKALEAKPNDQAILSQLDELAAETRLRTTNRAEAEAAITDADKALPRTDPSMEVVQSASASAEPQSTRMDPVTFGKLARNSPSRLNDAELDALIDETGYRIASLPEGENEVYKQLQDKLLAEQVKRQPPPPLDVQFPAPLGGFAAGFAYGYISSDDQDRLSNAIMWGAVGAVGGAVGKSMLNSYEATKAAKKPEMYPGQHSMPKFISYTSERVTKKLPLMAQLRHYYSGLFRGTSGAENIVNELGGAKLPAYKNFSTLASIFGRWVGISDHWQTAYPVLEKLDGTMIPLDALPLAKIKDLAQGDIENLDELAVAMTTLENLGKPNWKPPIDVTRAQLIYSNAPQHLHEAARQMRKYFLALADVMVNSGGLSQATRDKFATEAFYTALHRVVGEGEAEGWMAKRLGQLESITSPNPVKPRKGGSTLQVKSPFETASEMTARYIRAAELNKIKQQYLAFALAQEPGVRSTLARRMDKQKFAGLSQVQVLSDQIKAELPTIDKVDADKLAASFGGELNNDSPVMTVYEEGVLRQYRVNQTIFDMFKHLMPAELNSALHGLSLPTRVAAKTIAYHPLFIPMMEFVNTFQASLMSRYGFKPGIDTFRGWWAAMSNSPEYQKLLAAGGPATIQSLSYVNTATARKVLQATGRNPIETAVNLVKELHPWEAYKTLVHPLAEASRIGEGLRALNHGESAIDAVNAAWHVTGNTRMQGSFTAMRAFNLLTLFSRPAISALEEAATKTGLNPLRAPQPSKGVMADMLREMGFKNDRVISGTEFWSKGFAYLTIPTVMLWYANKDDQEITQLRQTASGRKYWWFRANDEIFKVRKPHVLGQIFGSTVEDLLDGGQVSSDWVGGLVNDAAFNIVPQIGVVPFSLWAGKNLGLGSQIVPQGDQGLLPSMQGSLEASNPARVIADKLSPISNTMQSPTLRTAMSPAGIDFIVNNAFGMMGQDAMLTLDWFINKQRLDMPPANNELPVVGRLYGRYPSMNTRPVRDFYKLAGQVETVQKSFNELLQHKPQLAVQFQARHQLELRFAEVFQQQRVAIANYRRQMEDMKFMLQNGQMKPDEYRLVEAEVLKRIIQITAATVQAARPLQEQ